MPGWTGAGYIILDPVTGAGAYKITGASNGGFLAAFAMTVVAFIITIGFIGGAIASGGSLILLFWPILSLLSEALNFKLWIDAIKAADTSAAFDTANAGQFFGELLGLLPFDDVAEVPQAAVVKWFGVFWAFLLTNNF